MQFWIIVTVFQDGKPAVYVSRSEKEAIELAIEISAESEDAGVSVWRCSDLDFNAPSAEPVLVGCF